jgi:hypothetical protein
VRFTRELQADRSLNALQRLNLLLSLGRDWKREHIAELRAMLITLLYPENAVLYHRIVGAAMDVLAPALAAIIAQGEAEGVFDAGEPQMAAEVLLGLSTGRRTLVITALAEAERDVEGGLAMIVERVRAEEAVTNRLLGLQPGAVDLMGPPDVMREMLLDWNLAGPH